jgi:hypothetical protein
MIFLFMGTEDQELCSSSDVALQGLIPSTVLMSVVATLVRTTVTTTSTRAF